jgi:excisionase family DNA binding protein
MADQGTTVQHAPGEPSMRSAVESQPGEYASTYRSVAELAADIGLSERSTRDALRRGEIPHIRIGRRFVLPRAAIAEWLRTAGRKVEPVSAATRPAKLVAVLAAQR